MSQNTFPQSESHNEANCSSILPANASGWPETCGRMTSQGKKDKDQMPNKRTTRGDGIKIMTPPTWSKADFKLRWPVFKVGASWPLQAR